MTAVRRAWPHVVVASAVLACIALLVALAAAVRWQADRYADARDLAEPSSAEYVQMQWDGLIPKGWDPVKRVRDKVRSEYPDSGVAARELAKEMRRTWDNAPTNLALDGAKIRLAGWVVPLQADTNKLQEFLLVPYFGACIHVPPPPANQIVHVLLDAPVERIGSMDFVTVSGALHTARRDSAMGMSGYTMAAVRVEKRRPGMP